MLEDSSRPLAERARAYRAFLTFDPRDIPLAVKYRDVFVEADPARAAATFEQLITARGRGTAYFGDFEGTLRYLEWLRPLAEPNFNYRTTLFGIHALAALGRLDEATDLAREAVDYAGFAPPETYQMQMIRAALAIRDPATTVEQAAARLAAEDAAATRDRPLTSEQRAEALAFVGTTALHANLEPVVRALDALRRGLYVPEPTKRYTVTYSPRPITGIDSWDRFAPRTERQVLDRGYGGNMEFLATDVSTGDRGAGIRSGTGDDTRRFTELSLVCDVNGIHIRLDAFDERAREIGAKLLGGGSYEGYIAPGENQPYLCFLVDIQSGRVSLYNTTYDNRNHKRIPVEETGLWRGEHRFNDQGYTTYLFFSWEAYADKLPEDGDRWDFENAHWGRSGSYTWNGLKSIHGRSSWGQLAFDIPEKARLDIKRKLIFSALARYQAEKRTSHHHEGVLDHWLDEVVGDPAFYRARVQPLVDRLDAFIPRVKVDMTDDEVEHVFLEAVHGWNNIRHLVAAERRNYLAGQLAP